MGDATQLLGAKLSLVSKTKIRYVGTLLDVSPGAGTLTLSEVRCMGSEHRREGVVPPSAVVYQQVVFKAEDIEELVVEEQAAPTPFNDPAIVSATVAEEQPAAPLHSSAQAAHSRPPLPREPPPQRHALAQARPPSSYANAAAGGQHAGRPAGRPMTTAAAAAPGMMGAAGAAGPGHRGGRGGYGGHALPHRGGHGGPGAGMPGMPGGAGAGMPAGGPSAKSGSGAALTGLREYGGGRGRPNLGAVKASEFDFEEANKAINDVKAELLAADGTKADTRIIEETGEVEMKPMLAQPAYDKSKGFFDSLATGAGGLRRDQERKLNQETFGAIGISHAFNYGGV